MRGTRYASIAILFCLAFPCGASGQVHDRFEDWCEGFKNASLSDLAQFLNAVVPDESNSRCVTWTIHELGRAHYEPAIPALAKFLDFRRPLAPAEQIFHGLSLDLYPAETALELIGRKSLPAVLGVIKADSSSVVAQENAVDVWMVVYRATDEQPKGVARLKQEEARASDDATKQRLRRAIGKALAQCNPPEQAACREAAGSAAP